MLKKIVAMTAAAAVTFSNCYAVSDAFLAEQTKSGAVKIEQTGDKITIGNNAIKREFDLQNGKLTTAKIDNLLGNKSFVPAKGSEEFVINLLKGVTLQKPEVGSLTSVKENWKIEGTSVQNNDGSGYEALIDGDLDSYYHSRYNENGSGTQREMPVDITLDRGENSKAFQTFGYRPRKGQPTSNGNVLEFEIYVSDDKDKLYTEENKKIASKFIYVDGIYEGETPNYLYTSFDSEQTGRYVGFRVLKGQGGPFVAGTEIDLYKEKFDSFDREALYPNKSIQTSDLELDGAPVIQDTVAQINGQKKEGKMISFKFKTLNANQPDAVDITENVVMYNDDHFMRKFLEVKFADEKQQIDYIDGEHLLVNETDDTWTVPHVGGVVQMEEFKANLGQPIYINGMFLGSEFPATDTQIEDNLGHIRYYTGKNFADFKRDQQLTKDGKYVTWQTVLGASPAADTKGTNMDIAKQSLFNYIDSIATPSEFRIQYNSWFDNMMRITDENILSSFSAVDQHLSETGVRPIDSYVVDDGWNLYRKTAGQMSSKEDVERNGPVNEVNTEGFWQFNSKFPNGLTPSSELVQNFGSNFGVWVGPRGGYNYYGTLAEIIQESGKGSAAGGSIDVADKRYVDNFKQMAIDWMNKYKVNYWKWDGFADSAQYQAFPSGTGVVGYDEAHQHMYGGVNNMYHVTDLWEKWITLMTDVRKEAENLKVDDLWISLTCYVNPSPWYLQWANSVWLQCVADRGERTNGNAAMNNKMDNMLTYRDGAYYDFIVQHQFQFPLANIYNHDPIYGTEGTGIDAKSMNAEQFRNYLFMQGTRGTAFWELYYSDSILDEEKYLINADFLQWEEKNFDMLRNAIMIGGNPSETAKLNANPTGEAGKQNPYGFAGFNAKGDEGIISMRNPSAKEMEIKFTLDEAIGAKTAKDTVYHVTKDHAYVPEGVTSKASIPSEMKKGQEVKVTLQPGEVYVLHLNVTKDTDAPQVDKIYLKDSKTVRVRTSEHVKDAAFIVQVDGKPVDAKISKQYSDLRSFDLTLDTELSNGQNVEVQAKGGTDDAGNALNGAKALDYYKDGLIVSKDASDAIISDAKASVKGENGFAVSATVKTNKKDAVLLSQGEAYQLGIDKDGHAYFELNGVRATSDAVVPADKETVLTGVKENNGIIKLYVDGKVNKSAYDTKNKEFAVKEDSIKGSTDNAVTAIKVYNRSLGYNEVASLAGK